VAFSAGELIGGRYRLEELIGSGGMGDVFRARDTLLERAVAIKLVDVVDPRRRDETTQNFLREARISAAIAHRNVVQILDFGVDGGVVPFIVMELLEGETLAAVLGRGQRVPFGVIVELADQVLDGLAAAHQAGVVHRDLKPENIYLVRSRSGIAPKILDFGISKLTDERGAAHITTSQGHVVGTPAYMSPEQARGVKFIDKRTDIYSMGVVLYELLSGEMPFYSENPGDLMVMIVTGQARPLSECSGGVPHGLSDVVERAMRKKPEDRFADAHEMQDALRAASAELRGTATARALDERELPTSWRRRPSSASHGAVTEAEATPRGTPASALHGRRKLAVSLAAGLAAVAVVVGIVLLTRSNAAPAPRFIVVQADRGRAPLEGGEPTMVSGVSTESAVAPPAQAAAAPEPRRASQKRAASDPAERLAESFRRQKGSVEACVNEHASEAQRTPRLSVYIALDTSGNVRSARIMPANLAGGTMGACITRAVSAMQFPRQSAPITFEVPLTARKE